MLVTIEFIAIIISIAVWWCNLFAVLSGLGLLARRAFGLPVQKVETWLLSFWGGWVFAILILQLWHLWWKIDIWTFAFIVVLGSAGLLWNRKDVWQLVRACLGRKFWLVSIVSLLAFWVANRALAPIENGDTGLYHMTSVKWATSYPIVPGLGNLHGRLAFNSTFFLYAAMLEVGPWVQKSYYLANGLLVFVLLVQLLLSLEKFIRGIRKYRSYHVFNVLLLAPTLGQMLHPRFSSLTPDITRFVLEIILLSSIYFFLINDDRDIKEESYNVFLITILCSVGVTIKLSFIPLGVSAAVLVIAVWLFRYARRDQSRIKYILCWIFIVNISLLGTWAIRGVILSGYILFPYAWGSVPVTWRVPRPLVLSEANWAYSWARAPEVFWGEVLHNWSWLGPWLRNFPPEYIKPRITGLLGIIVYC